MKRYQVTAEMTEAMAVMRRNGATYQQIGEAFSLHHTSVIYALTGRRKSEYRHDKRSLAQILRNAADCLEALSQTR